MKIYETRGLVETADCVIGHSFGSSIGEGSVNYQIAQQMVNLAAGKPMIADRTLVDALPEGDELMAHVIEGPRTNIKAEGLGTWGALIGAKEYMDEHGLSSPLMVAQAYHITRVARQAAKLGITSIIPEGLPTDFDRQSEQIWTRSALLWVPFNGLGTLLLKKRGRI